MDKEIRILIAEDSAVDAELIARELVKEGFAHTSKLVKSKDEFLKALGEFAPDVILCDYTMPSFSAQEALDIVKKCYPETPLIIVSGTIGEDIAVDTMKLGAIDYILKDRLGRLVPAVRRALEEARMASDHKQAQKALNESEQKYRELVMLANSIILRWTRDGRITFLNEFGQRFFGYTEAEICGRHVVGTIVPAIESSGRNLPLLMDEICANPAAFEQNINENMRRNGEHVWIAWTNKVVLDPQGQVAEILSIGVDITERRKMQEELRKWSDELEKKVKERTKELIAAREAALNIFNSTRDAVMLLTSEKGFFKGNPATIEIFGCRDELEFTRMTPADLSPRYQPDGKLSTVKTQEMMAIAMEKGSHFFEWTHKRVNGQEFFADVLLTRMKWEDRMVLQATVRDITERIKSEKAVRNLLADLQEAKVFLEASITSFHNIVARSTDGIVIVAKTGIVQFANPAAETFLGHTEKNLIGQLFRFPVETSKITEIDIIRDNKEAGVAEMRVVETKWNNNPAWLALLRDITDRKRAEETLAIQRMFSSTVLENMDAGVVACNEKGELVLFNRVAREWHGLDPLNIPQTEWADHYNLYLEDGVTPMDANTIPLVRAFRGENLHGIGMVIAAKGQPKRDILAHAGPIKGEDGRVLGAIAVMHDITEHKRAEDMIRESEEKFRTIFERNNDGILIADAKNKKFLTGNKAICDMLGYGIEEIRKIDISDIHPKEDLPFVEEQFDKLARKEIALAENIPMKRKNGSIFFADINANPTIISGQKCLIGSFRDITERKLAEEKLKEAMKAKSEFTSVVSHELRTPLTSIKEGIALVFDGLVGDVNEEQKELLGIAKKNVDRLARLINDILDFQKLDSGVMKFNFGANNINKIAEDVYATMASLAKKAGLNLLLELDNSLPRCSFDNDKITQVLTNLVTNAMKFTKQGNITIKTGRDNDSIRVSVSDTGCGIREEDIPKVFNKFEQLNHGGDRKTGGTGLGLAISREIIEQHIGTLWFESQFGKGSTFTFALPVCNTDGLSEKLTMEQGKRN